MFIMHFLSRRLAVIFSHRVPLYLNVDKDGDWKISPHKQRGERGIVSLAGTGTGSTPGCGGKRGIVSLAGTGTGSTPGRAMDPLTSLIIHAIIFLLYIVNIYSTTHTEGVGTNGMQVLRASGSSPCCFQNFVVNDSFIHYCFLGPKFAHREVPCPHVLYHSRKIRIDKFVRVLNRWCSIYIIYFINPLGILFHRLN